MLFEAHRRGLMRGLFIVGLAMILSLPISFAATQENTELVIELVQESGLEDKMAKDQANDLVRLRKALLKAANKDADAQGYMEAIRNDFLPEITKIQNESIKAHQYLIVQYNLILIAAENGYEEQRN